MENKTDMKNVKPEKTFGDKVGGAVEKTGEKIADLGAKNLGQKIHNAGDKMETHHKNPNHPRDVR